MKGWDKLKLKEICEFKYGKNLPEYSRELGPYPVYGSSGIVSYHKEYFKKGPGVIVGRKGTVGKVQYSKGPFFPIDTTYFIEENKSKVDLLFLYYLLPLYGLDTMNSDAAVPGLNREAAINVRILLPPLPIQRRIASILSAYDDLIENNLKRIKLLEELAQRTYEEWFVKFRINGEQLPMDDKTGLPVGWRKVKLEDVAEIKWGDTSVTKSSYCNSGYLAFSASGPDGYLDYFDYDRTGIVLSAIGAYAGLTWLAHNKWSAIKNTMIFWSKEKSLSNYYLYLATKGINYWNRRGAAQPFIAQGDAKLQQIIRPDTNTNESFEKNIEPLYILIQKLIEINKMLKASRDILLPKLMSGKINVA